MLDKPIGYAISHKESFHRGFSVQNPEDYMSGTRICNANDMINFLDDLDKAANKYSDQREKPKKYIFDVSVKECCSKRLIGYKEEMF